MRSFDLAQIDSAIRRGLSASRVRRDKHPEDALALAFADSHGDELRYVSFWGKWLKWTAGKWQVAMPSTMYHGITEGSQGDCR
jgi:hypothetical protein